MVKAGIDAFNGKKVLLLQGPVGPFFRRFAGDLTDQGAEVHTINFNGGDWFFNKKTSINFRDHPRNWRGFFETVLETHNIDTIFLFGDCRPIHIVALQIATARNIEVGVFEEGYIRPNFITLEPGGVNNHSHASREASFYFNRKFSEPPVETQIGYTFWHMFIWAILYYLFSNLLKPVFRYYRHHRPLHLLEGLKWIRGFWRKWFYKIKERKMQKLLTGNLSKHYFLLPLQVYNDSQIHTHSDFATVEQFIRFVIKSFAKHAPLNTYLVIKHHPMDRGYNDYTNWLEQLEFLYDLSGRVFYIHDQHLPSLLDHAIGTVVVNSTVGLSALLHNSPLKVCGRAIYDFEGLTFQGSLDEFWQTAPTLKINSSLFGRFRNYLINSTQINGNFYKKLSNRDNLTGLAWPPIEKPHSTKS